MGGATGAAGLWADANPEPPRAFRRRMRLGGSSEGGAMAEKLSLNAVVTLEELVIAQTFEQEALINLLDRKRLIKKAEFLEEVKRAGRGPGQIEQLAALS